MAIPFLPSFASVRQPVIGMLHLPPLPGAPLSTLSLAAVREHLLRDLDALIDGGVHGLMMENFGDVPFFPGRVPTAVATIMTALAVAVREKAPQLPLGINVLRNDGLTAMAVAHAAGAAYVRVNVLSGARVTDQGLIEGIAHELLRERAALKSTVKIMADVDVKHSAPLAARPIVDEVDDTLHRGLADALVVSGAGTGKPTDPAKAGAVKARAGGRARVFIGSGITAETIADFVDAADGFIVGTAFKPDGDPNAPVNAARVRDLMARVQ